MRKITIEDYELYVSGPFASPSIVWLIRFNDTGKRAIIKLTSKNNIDQISYHIRAGGEFSLHRKLEYEFAIYPLEEYISLEQVFRDSDTVKYTGDDSSDWFSWSRSIIDQYFTIDNM